MQTLFSLPLEKLMRLPGILCQIHSDLRQAFVRYITPSRHKNLCVAGLQGFAVPCVTSR